MYSLLQVLKLIFDVFCEITALISTFQRYIDTLREMKDNMRINGFKCDDCGNIHNDASLPQGWVELDQKLEDNKRKFYHFCSLDCLRAWSIKKSMSDSEAK